MMKSDGKLKILHTDGRNQDFIDLCVLLDETIDEIAGNPAKRDKYVPYNQLNDIHDVVVIYWNGEPAASGSYRHYEEGIAEIKRVFVNKSFRGKGLSKIIMNELETKALNSGYKKFILETGDVLTASMNLYKSMGFTVVENYGPYINMCESICMEKKLKKCLGV